MATGTVELFTFWNEGRTDNLTVGSPEGILDAGSAGYVKVRPECRVLARADKGLLPLNLYWHAGRQDNLLVASEKGNQDAKDAGYAFVRTEGYCFTAESGPTPKDASHVPLKLYYHEGRQDNLSAANPDTIKDAEAAGYVLQRVEAMVLQH
ncbi:hypothetical protein DFJ74DRAFT_693992 [Hyaloraphidium curvatum]|nr:hypothetical protein DFJ74DRAFT_693992 [Hyaloraphidium curvatum]